MRIRNQRKEKAAGRQSKATRSVVLPARRVRRTAAEEHIDIKLRRLYPRYKAVKPP